MVLLSHWLALETSNVRTDQWLIQHERRGVMLEVGVSVNDLTSMRICWGGGGFRNAVVWIQVECVETTLPKSPPKQNIGHYFNLYPFRVLKTDIDTTGFKARRTRDCAMLRITLHLCFQQFYDL